MSDPREPEKLREGINAMLKELGLDQTTLGEFGKKKSTPPAYTVTLTPDEAETLTIAWALVAAAMLLDPVGMALVAGELKKHMPAMESITSKMEKLTEELD